MAKKQEIQDKRYELYERAHTKEYYAVAKWLSEVSFKPSILGADQADVWRKMEKLCELYEAAIDAERARNAKLERKLRSLTVSKQSTVQGNPEQHNVVQEPRTVESNQPELESVSAPVLEYKKELVQKEITQTVQQVTKKQPRVGRNSDTLVEPVVKSVKNTSPDEEILLDLIREFGPDEGGKNNG